ncbi:MAG TPA: dipeptide epimerase, partial [Dongiaceae bacterium]
MRRLTVTAESFPIAVAFTISRGSKTVAEVVSVEIAEGGHRGRGECVPYGRYGETIAGSIAEIEALRGDLERGLERRELQGRMKAGAARNAVDCALWDLEAKRAGRRASELAGLPAL